MICDHSPRRTAEAEGLRRAISRFRDIYECAVIRCRMGERRCADQGLLGARRCAHGPRGQRRGAAIDRERADVDELAGIIPSAESKRHENEIIANNYFR